MDIFIAYIMLFVSCFGAATLLPINSEIVLLATAYNEDYQKWVLWLIASVGNILGAVFNWWLGLNISNYQHRKWFPVSEKSITRLTPFYQKYGRWSLLLAWMPFIGDPLTLIAGIFKMPLRYFLPFVAIGKAGRYALLLGPVDIYFTVLP
jgi:membrane protein YqaA with SNARE-associated domain